MPRQLKSTGQALDLLFALTFDDDNTTLKEFVDPNVNDSMVVDEDVEFDTTTWHGETRGTFKTLANGGFGFKGIDFSASPNVQAIAPAANEVCIVLLCAGSGVGANGQFWVAFNGDTHGLGADGTGKLRITFGSTGCVGGTTIPTDETTKFFAAGNWSGPSGSETGEVFYALESDDEVESDGTASVGSFGSNVPLTHIGGPPGNGNLPFEGIALYMFEGLRTLEQLQAIFDDDIGELFGVAEPGTIEEATIRFSGGSSNADPDASIGGAESTRQLLTGIRNNLFAPITPAQAAAGRTDYRCFFLHGDTDGDLADVDIWIHDNADEAHTTFAIGLDPAGVGEDAATPANDTTAPSGVTFSSPTSGAPLNIGNIPPNQGIAVWIRRTIAAGAVFTASDGLTLRPSDGTDTIDLRFVHNVQATEARTWSAIGANTMASQDPCPGNGCTYSASGGQLTIMTSNGGGCLQQIGNTIRMIVWGGGHGDYGGNEVYAFDYVTRLWSRLTTPSTPSGGSEASGKYGDGLPRSTHTYSYLEYDRFNNAMFVAAIPATYPNAGASAQAFNYDFDDGAWDLTLPSGGPANPIGGSVGGGDDGITCYVTGRDEIVFQPAQSRDNWARWDPVTKTWYDYQGGNGTHRGAQVAVYDSRRDKVYGLGGQSSSNVVIWDRHAGGNSTLQATTGTGAAAITSSISAGYCYDELLDRVIAWDGGQTLRALDPVSWAWSALTVSGVTPTSPQTQGSYGRFRWIQPCSQYPAGAYTVVNSVSESVYIFASESGATYNVAVSEAGAAADSVSPALLAASAFAEAVTASHTQVSIITLPAALTEAASSSDSVAGNRSMLIAFLEAGIASDSKSSELIAAGSVAEAAASLDEFNRELLSGSALSEPASAADSVSSVASVATRSISESVLAQDSSNAALVAVCDTSNAVSANDLVSALTVVLGSISDAASAADSTSGSIAANQYDLAILESASAADSFTHLFTAVAQLQEAGNAVDAHAALLDAVAGLLEAANAGEVLLAQFSGIASIEEIAAALDSVTTTPRAPTRGTRIFLVSGRRRTITIQ